MRVRNNFKENKREEIKNKITVTVLATTLAVAPAAIVHKFDQLKIDAMINYYETMIEEEKEKSYMQGFLDGLFGVEDNFYTPVEEILLDTNDLIVKIPEQEQAKKLVYAKKNIKY